MADRNMLKLLEMRTNFHNGALRSGGEGIYWIDYLTGVLYEFACDNVNLSVDDLTDEELGQIKEQLLFKYDE
jgi:hypothetical protein